VAIIVRGADNLTGPARLGVWVRSAVVVSGWEPSRVSCLLGYVGLPLGGIAMTSFVASAGEQAMPSVPGVRHQVVDTGRLRMHVASAGVGSPVVLLHGWPQHWRAWRSVIPLLAHSYHVGHDVGGRVGFELSLRAPPLVRRLVSVNAAHPFWTARSMKLSGRGARSGRHPVRVRRWSAAARPVLNRAGPALVAGVLRRFTDDVLGR
jgi:pimeloyl-ACP methyl ester carboxylesterase